MTTPMPAAARRRLLLAAGLAVLLAAAATITAVVLTRPPEPSGPLTAEGLFPVVVPRTVENVDLCSLLTDDEAAALLGPSTGRGGHIYERECIFPGDLLGILHTYPIDNTTGYTRPEFGPNTTVAGYPAKIRIPDGYRNCRAVIIVEPRPDRPALGMALLTSPDCEALRAAAELMVPRLPLAPR